MLGWALLLLAGAGHRESAVVSVSCSHACACGTPDHSTLGGCPPVRLALSSPPTFASFALYKTLRKHVSTAGSQTTMRTNLLTPHKLSHDLAINTLPR